MSTKSRYEDDEPKAKATPTPPKEVSSTSGEVNEDLAKVPYPTGSPPDPMEEYYKHHPERIPPEETEPPAADEAKASKRK